MKAVTASAGSVADYAILSECSTQTQDVLRKLLALPDEQILLLLDSVRDSRPDLWQLVPGLGSLIDLAPPPVPSRPCVKFRGRDIEPPPRLMTSLSPMHRFQTAGPFSSAGSFSVMSAGSAAEHSNEELQGQDADEESNRSPIIQFSAATYYCTEDEGSMQIDIIRIGDLSRRSTVLLRTKDISAMAGENYIPMKMEIIFDPGEDTRSAEVELIRNVKWDTTLQFSVELHSAGRSSNAFASLGRYLWHSTVSIIDTDCFPSNKHKACFTNGILEERDGLRVSLFLEYCKLNWQDPTVRSRSKRIMFIDQLHNLNLFMLLFVHVYLVDYVLRHHGVNPPKLLFTDSKQVSLILIVAVSVLPFAIIHALDYVKAEKCGVGGTSRGILQKALIRKYFNYAPEYRQNIGSGNVIMAMTRDAVDVVTSGYQTTLRMLRDIGHLALMLIYQFSAPWVFSKPYSNVWMGCLPLAVYPVFMLTFMYFRNLLTQRLVNEQNDRQDDLVKTVDESVDNYKLIADYSRRELFVEHIGTSIKLYNVARRHCWLVRLNNLYFAKWLSVLLVALYTLIGGREVVKGNVSLGMFLANLRMVSTIGQAMNSLYDGAMRCLATMSGLVNIAVLMNTPTDLLHRKLLNRKNRIVTKLLRKELLKENHYLPAVDRLPIVISNLRSSLVALPRTTLLNQQGVLRIHQGQLVALYGPKGGGKKTLMNHLGGSQLPTPESVRLPQDVSSKESCFFLPVHLRCVNVTGPMFFHGTLIRNITIGVAEHDSDGSMERIMKICLLLGISQGILEYLRSPQEHDWDQVFCASDCQVLSLARALITNSEILCLHKPLEIFDHQTRHHLMHVFRRSVDERGLLQSKPPDARRPRTMVFTCMDNHTLEHADSIFRISKETGIERVEPGPGL